MMLMKFRRPLSRFLEVVSVRGWGMRGREREREREAGRLLIRLMLAVRSPLLLLRIVGLVESRLVPAWSLWRRFIFRVHDAYVVRGMDE